MDCRTARTLIDFARPNAPELEPGAATVLLGWGIFRWSRGGPAPVDPAEITSQFEAFRISPDADKVQDMLRALDAEAPAPADLRYRYLAAPPALVKLRGKWVPLLVFVNGDEQKLASEDAKVLVYLLSARDFNLKDAPATFTSPGSFHFRAEVVPQGAEHAYLVLHTGDDWKWLRYPTGDAAE